LNAWTPGQTIPAEILNFLLNVRDATDLNAKTYLASLWNRTQASVATITALKALTGMADKDRVFVDFDGRGWYTFVLGAPVGTFADDLWIVDATDGSGVWEAAGIKLHPTRERLVATPATPFDTTSATYVDATGWSVTSKGTIGDHLEIRFSGQLPSISGSGVFRYAKLVVTDPSGTTALDITERRLDANALQESGYDVAADYTLGATGTYTVKLQVHCDGTQHAAVEAGSMLSVVRYKP
jgi:hypothetical protein